MEIENKKAYKLWGKFRDISLPFILLWAFIIAPNLKKENALTEIIKTASFFLIFAVIVFLPTILITFLFLKRFPEFANDNVKQESKQPITSYKATWFLVFLVFMLVLIFCLAILALKVTQNFGLDSILFN